MSVDFWIPGRAGNGPMVNFANTNARGIIRLLRLPDDGYLSGSVGSQEVHRVLRTIMDVLARPETREGLLRAQHTERRSHLWDDGGIPTISPGMTVIWSGNTDEQTVRRVEAIRDLFTQAAALGEGVCWG